MDLRSPPALLVPALLDATGGTFALADPSGATQHLTPQARQALGAVSAPWPALDALDAAARERGLEVRRVVLPGGWALALYRNVGARANALGVALHDLRSPVANLRTYAGLLARGKVEGEKLAKAGQVMIRNSERALALITDFLESELSGLGALELHRREVSLLEVAQAAAEQQSAALIERDVRLEFAPGPPVVVHVDLERTVRAVAAVLGLAASRAPSGTAVEVGISERGGSPALVIRDQGPPTDSNLLRSDRDAAIARDRRLTPALQLDLAQATLEAQGGRIEVTREREQTSWWIFPADR